jgi:WD40 repeat protein
VATQLPSPSCDDPTRTSEPVATATPGPAPAPGSRAIGTTQVRDPERYQIIGEHGRGGLGRVSRAHDHELGRDIAIKELISRGHVGEVRFVREALITARLEHPGIVPIYEAGRWPDGTPFYAMKLVAGRSLRELIAERPTIAQRIGLLHHVIAVADAIAYAHGRNIIHRDLKPANVIVGDFGETIVIDWGLAKDLSAAEETTVGGGPFRANRDDGLTSTGSVLGTPAYMAPEQGRGERVDQRADVFAIGAMLWELCALKKVPPTEPHLRHRTLRRSGIDNDLVTIIDKALDPDPARRYPDAGALAADLKAFKSGARIAARSYSLFAMLAHWIRRHRKLAVAATATVALGVVGSALFVRNIAVERDRADTAFERVEATKNDLVLEHAELLLHSDPTAALAALSGYRGDDTQRRRRIVAEARGRGVAIAAVTPHSDVIWLVAGINADQIISVGDDRRVRVTQGGTSTTLAADVGLGDLVRYAPSKHLLAYPSVPAGIALLDLNTRTPKKLSTIHALGLELSQDGSRLAALDDHDELIVWSLEPQPVMIYHARFPGVSAVRFATPTRIIVQNRTTMQVVSLDTTPTPIITREISNVAGFDAQSDAVVVGFDDGRMAILSPALTALESLAVCRKVLSYVRFVPSSKQVAFACQDGVAGLVRYGAPSGPPLIVDSFPTKGPTFVVPDPSGRYVFVADDSRTAFMYDMKTRLVTRYDGNAGQPTCASAPTSDFKYVLIGDASGTVRVWEPPTSLARVVLQTSSAIYGLSFTPDSKSLIASGNDRIVRNIDIESGSTKELHGHVGGVQGTQASPDGKTLLSYGYDDTVRVWRTADSTMARVLDNHTGAIGEADYTGHGDRIVSVGDDGRLLAWSPEGADMSVLFTHSSPLTRLEVLGYNEHIVVKDTKGGVWDISPDRSIRQVRGADGTMITILRASLDGRYVGIGTDRGEVVIYDTASWRVIRTANAAGRIQHIRFDPRNRDVAVLSEGGTSQFGHVQVMSLDMRRTLHWRDMTMAARDIAYSPDGEVLGFVCRDGGAWLYSMHDDAWVYVQDHQTNTSVGVFSPDGHFFASADRRGVVVIRDVMSSLSVHR